MQNVRFSTRTSILFAILFAALICWKPALGALDDRVFFLPFDILRCWGEGRFYILDAIEQVTLNHFFGLSPLMFYAVNALEFLTLFYLLFRLSGKTWIPILVALTPGICTAFFRLYVPERLLVVCITSLVLLDQNGVGDRKRKLAYVLLASISYFLKEPVFLIIGGLSFFRFLEKKERPFHLFMMGLSAAYGALVFVLTRIVRASAESYGMGNHEGLRTVFKNIFNFTLNDPAIVLFCIPLWAYLLIRSKKLDPYLTLIVGYLSVFLMLGLYQEYYLLPLLPFVIIVLMKYWPRLPTFAQGLFIVLFLNTVLSGLGQISVYKNEPRGFSETMEKLAQQPVSAQTQVCYLGLNSTFSREILSSSASFFHHFNPYSEIPHFVGVRKGESTEQCHYLINSPYNFDQTHASSDWNEIYRFESSFRIPNFSLRTWIKYAAIQSGKKVEDRNVFRKPEFIFYGSPKLQSEHHD